MNNTREHPVVISIQDVKDHLQKGVTRCIGDSNYNSDIGSIQEIYSLNKGEVSLLFKDMRLKGLRTKSSKSPAFLIQEDAGNSILSPETEEPEVEIIDGAQITGGNIASRDGLLAAMSEVPLRMSDSPNASITTTLTADQEVPSEMSADDF